MITDPKRYREKSERQRVLLLQQLTYRQSARLVEVLISSRLIRGLHYSEDDRPRALARRFHAHR
ncbi:MAG: hypothetical protein Q8R91_07955 [Candidatus Omnitrophota bacterium]|nr:hypothetical protein [Candidatus Omnitrophota bacterium]